MAKKSAKGKKRGGAESLHERVARLRNALDDLAKRVGDAESALEAHASSVARRAETGVSGAIKAAGQLPAKATAAARSKTRKATTRARSASTTARKTTTSAAGVARKTATAGARSATTRARTATTRARSAATRKASGSGARSSGTPEGS